MYRSTSPDDIPLYMMVEMDQILGDSVTKAPTTKKRRLPRCRNVKKKVDAVFDVQEYAVRAHKLYKRLE